MEDLPVPGDGTPLKPRIEPSRNIAPIIAPSRPGKPMGRRMALPANTATGAMPENGRLVHSHIHVVVLNNSLDPGALLKIHAHAACLEAGGLGHRTDASHRACHRALRSAVTSFARHGG
jgi:hypothetical protein